MCSKLNVMKCQCVIVSIKRDVRDVFYQLEHGNQTSHLADDHIPTPTSH
jgi:hypothetical protein